MKRLTYFERGGEEVTLCRSRVEVPGRLPLLGWVLVWPSGDWTRLAFAGTRAEVAACLRTVGWEEVERK